MNACTLLLPVAGGGALDSQVPHAGLDLGKLPGHLARFRLQILVKVMLG